MITDREHASTLTQVNNVKLDAQFTYAPKSRILIHLVFGTMGEYENSILILKRYYITIEHNGRSDTFLNQVRFYLSKVHDSHNIQFSGFVVLGGIKGYSIFNQAKVSWVSQLKKLKPMNY
jgi:hypothetical protein